MSWRDLVVVAVLRQLLDPKVSATERHALTVLQRPQIESNLVIRCPHVNDIYPTELKGMAIVRQLRQNGLVLVVSVET